jgi:hypothetical protein
VELKTQQLKDTKAALKEAKQDAKKAAADTRAGGPGRKGAKGAAGAGGASDAQVLAFSVEFI